MILNYNIDGRLVNSAKIKASAIRKNQPPPEAVYDPYEHDVSAFPYVTFKYCLQDSSTLLRDFS